MLSIWAMCVCNVLNSAKQQVFVNFNSVCYREKREVCHELHNLSKTLVWGSYNWHEMAAGSKFPMDFFFLNKTSTAKPFAKTEGNVDPIFSLHG